MQIHRSFAVPAAALFVFLGACAVQSSSEETTDQSSAMQDLPRCDACCAKGGTWDSSHWMCCIPTKGGGSVCTNRPEDIKDVKLEPTTPPPVYTAPVVPTATATFASP